MATIRPKVLSTSGHDELLLDADNLKLAAAPTLNEHGTNKAYVDTSVATEATARTNADSTLQSNIDALDTDLQGQIDTINGDITTIEGAYVRDTGDNMTGNLTLGTTQIVLNATNGNSTFAGDLIVNSYANGCALFPDGGATFGGATVAVNGSTGDFTVGSGSFTVRSTDGAVECDSRIEVGSGDIDSDANATKTLIGSGALYMSRSGATNPVFRGRTAGSLTITSRINADGSATFAGALEAASVDGGTY